LNVEKYPQYQNQFNINYITVVIDVKPIGVRNLITVYVVVAPSDEVVERKHHINK
jgi:hypothetical protein